MAIVTELIADQFGMIITKHSERIQLRQNGDVVAQAPLLHLEQVIVAGRGISISADALQACVERGIPVHFLSSRGEPYAAIYASGLSGTVIARREQMLAFCDARGVHLALGFAAGKIGNQASTLKYYAKNRRESDPGAAAEMDQLASEIQGMLRDLDGLTGETPDEVRGSLLALEGNAARLYWAGARLAVPADYGWDGRTGRGATDPINALLNYGYGILYQQVQRAIVLAGLDPYAGFIHTDRPGKPSLVLDLTEEFRQVAVDRVVIGLAARGFRVEQEEDGLMTLDTRRAFAEHVLGHLESQTRYQGKRFPLRAVIQMQARAVAAYLRGDSAEYQPFAAGW
ncbi:MAG: CRISPR-associated endonuclease Cas1 [Anaerolineae bacterium]